MRRSTVLSFNRIRGLDFFVKNRLLIFMCALFSTGVLVGILSQTSADNITGFSKHLLSDFFGIREGATFFKTFTGSLWSAFSVIVTTFVLGGSLLGFVLVPILISLCGFCYGCMASLLCVQFGVKGIAFIAVVLIPSCLIFFVCLLFMAKHAVLFSWQVARLTLPKTQPVCLYSSFRVYCLRLAASCVFCIISALADASLSRALINLFDFGFQ